MPTVTLELRNSSGETIGTRRIREGEDTWLPSSATHVSVKSVEDTFGDG